MELVCASCRQRLVHVRAIVQSCNTNVGGSRTLHLSPLYAELSKPRVREEEATPPHSTEIGAKGHQADPNASSAMDLDSAVIRKRYHGDTAGGEEGVEEEWKELRLSWKELPSVYLKLSKSRLTTLVVLTAMGGYSMAPAPFDPSVLLWMAAGTGLCSAAANSFNQWIEIPYDSQMARTKNRVLVREKISPLHAVAFGTVSGVGGALMLWHLVNPLTAALGLVNLFLYTSLYTPMKRVSIINTWVGAVVGAIPPLMGWAACTGTLEPGALVLAGILYAWQFAHFNALSWGLRGDYSRAGYRMMAVTDPALCKRVALRYSVATVPLCTMAPVCDLTTWMFALDSLPVNLWLVYLSWRFYRDSDYKSSRRLFQYSLFHLPLIMALVLINKKKWWGREEGGTTSSAAMES